MRGIIGVDSKGEHIYEDGSDYTDISIRQEEDGDYRLYFSACGRNISDFLVSRKQMEGAASKVFVDKAVEWLCHRQLMDMEVKDIEKFINDFKKAMKQ